MTSKKPYKAQFGSLEWYEEVEDRAAEEAYKRGEKLRAERAAKAKPAPVDAPAK